MSRQRVLVVLAFAMMAVTAGGAVTALAPEEAGIPLASVPQGGSAHEVNDRHVVLVRHGDAVWGFLRQSSVGLGMVSWCPHDEVFLVPNYGTTFDKQGRLLRFHAWRDLDAVGVTVRGDTVMVATDQITPSDSTFAELLNAGKGGVFEPIERRRRQPILWNCLQQLQLALVQETSCRSALKIGDDVVAVREVARLDGLGESVEIVESCGCRLLVPLKEDRKANPILLGIDH